jgi:hypothetical protein
LPRPPFPKELELPEPPPPPPPPLPLLPPEPELDRPEERWKGGAEGCWEDVDVTYRVNP